MGLEGAAAALTNVANVLRDEGRMLQALHVYRQSLNLVKTPHAHAGLLGCLRVFTLVVGRQPLIQSFLFCFFLCSSSASFPLVRSYCISLWSLSGMAMVFHRAHQLHDAAMHYNEAIRLNPNFAECYTNLGECETSSSPLSLLPGGVLTPPCFFFFPGGFFFPPAPRPLPSLSLSLVPPPLS